MEPGHHADPLTEALGHGTQRAAQIASLAAAMAQAAIHRDTLRGARQAARDDQHAARALRQQERLLREQATAAWAPASDRQWLAAADVIQAGKAWAAAAGVAGHDPVAAAAMRRCEDRLRVLHPYAMARYDRLRHDGDDPLAAMEQAAPLFARAPAPHPGQAAASRPALTAGGEPPGGESAPGSRSPTGGGPGREPARSYPDSEAATDRAAVAVAALNFPHGAADALRAASGGQRRAGPQPTRATRQAVRHPGVP